MPRIHETAFVAETSVVIGRVSLEAYASVWYQCVLRGDINDIVIGPYSNVQDGSVLHVADACGCHIGSYVTIGHSAAVHACTVKDGALIGIGSRVLDGAEIGEGAIVGAGALILPGTQVPPQTLWGGVPARQLRVLSSEEAAMGKRLAKKYANRYLPIHQKIKRI